MNIIQDPLFYILAVPLVLLFGMGKGGLVKGMGKIAVPILLQLMPLAPIGVKLGTIVLHRVDQKLLYRFLYMVLFISGIKLCWDGLV